MNQKTIADIRKHFKTETDLLTIKTIYNVYIQQENNEIYHEARTRFAMLEQEQQELFFINFKKVLGGKIGSKLFEVRFQRPSEEEVNETQQILYDGLHAEDEETWEAYMKEIVTKMTEHIQYEKDVVVTFIRGQYNKPTKRHSEESEVAERDEVYTTPFILCSINQTMQPKRTLTFDFVEKAFKSTFIEDPIINVTSPLGGFLFPSFTDNAADVNHIVYAAGKVNKPDFHFIEQVLEGEEFMTAVEDKVVFEEIVKSVAGEELDTRTIASVYDEIQAMMEVAAEDDAADSIPMLDTKEVARVLKAGGIHDVDVDDVERAFRNVIEDETYEMQASHVVPSYATKSIKIETKVANIAISPQDLRYVRQVRVDGRRCLLIEVEEDTTIEGFTLPLEEL
ncbi:DUF4317 domain-containing protein [Sporosarcina sp. FSL K6-1522]|uniref:DUF4317 domain-containing protein n=1 Tax=Sporosarcina sp. FSL K6-1522 TaxID=2921554 RepID=UPI003159A3E1